MSDIPEESAANEETQSIHALEDKVKKKPGEFLSSIFDRVKVSGVKANIFSRSSKAQKAQESRRGLPGQ